MQRMKKFIYCALIALIAVSCDQTEGPGGIDIPIVIPQTFYAQTPLPEPGSRAVSEIQLEGWEDDSVAVNTRTYAVVDPANASEYYQYWSEGDAISLFFTVQNLQYIMKSYKDGTQDIGKFELVGSATQGATLSSDYYYSVYPYKANTSISRRGVVTYDFPSTQHYNGDSYANGENGMIAIEPMEGTDSVLYFQNFCSYLQLRMATDEGQTKTVKKITLVANNTKDAMAGVGTIAIESEGSAPIVEMKRGATNQITLDCGSGVELSQDENNPTKFWFVLPGGFTFTEGFSITVVFSDYSYFKKSTTKQIGIERSHIKPMAPFKPEGIKPNGPIRYKYNSGSKEEPFPLKNTFYGVDGSQLDVIEQIYDEETGEWIVLLSGTLKNIGDNSFEGPGPDIEYIKVDNDDESVIVNNFAFYNCTADNLIIQNNVDEINESAFTGSTIKDLNIYGDVTSIKNSAGTGSVIENINISGNVTAIEAKAFSGSEALAAINISGSVVTIDDEAFSGCKALQTINVGNIETIGYRAFYMCSNLTQVSVPEVKYVDEGAFRNCTRLETIDLGSVVTIEDNAFMDCSSLTEVTISENCTLIGEGAFCNAINLQEVYCYAVYPPFIKTDNYNSSYAFDNVHDNICIYIPIGSEDYYLDGDYFVGQELEDSNIEAEVNWWYEEYYDILLEELQPVVEN